MDEPPPQNQDNIEESVSHHISPVRDIRCAVPVLRWKVHGDSAVTWSAIHGDIRTGLHIGCVSNSYPFDK